MSAALWLNEAQLSRLKPYFPKSRGKLQVDDRKILSEVVYIQRNRLMWKDAPVDYSPLKTLYNCWKRWSRMGVFATIMTELAAEVPQIEMVMMPGPVGPVLLGDASIACQAMDQKVLMVTCPPETLSF